MNLNPSTEKKKDKAGNAPQQQLSVDNLLEMDDQPKPQSNPLDLISQLSGLQPP